MKPLRISVAVITDLETDQRVRKVCTWMQQQGYDLVVTGLKRPFSTQLQERPYAQNRLITRQQKGVLFYAEWQWKLFWALRKLPSDVIYANDLDTLFPAWLAAKIHGAALVYDSHEWFTEVPELLNQPFKKSPINNIEPTEGDAGSVAATGNDSYHGEFKSKSLRNCHPVRVTEPAVPVITTDVV